MRLSKITESAREAQALQAYRLVTSGSTVLDACSQVGITRRQYYFWISKSASSIDEIKGIISDQEREAILDIASARAEALKKISEAVYEEDNIGKLMQIESHLRGVQREIEDRHGISSLDRSAADFMLTGPATVSQESRTSIEIKETKSGMTLNISTPEVIDVEELNDKP